MFYSFSFKNKRHEKAKLEFQPDAFCSGDCGNDFYIFLRKEQ